MSSENVLRFNAAEDATDYREDVAEILRRIMFERKLTMVDVAEAIDVSLGTIKNATNKHCELNPVYLRRIARRYGAEALDPYMMRAGGRVVALDPPEASDILPFLARATLKIVATRDQKSGGPGESLKGQLDYLPELRALQREVDALICRIEQRKAAA